MNNRFNYVYINESSACISYNVTLVYSEESCGRQSSFLLVAEDYGHIGLVQLPEDSGFHRPVEPLNILALTDAFAFR
jgi:hypothetical protein